MHNPVREPKLPGPGRSGRSLPIKDDAEGAAENLTGGGSVGPQKGRRSPHPPQAALRVALDLGWCDHDHPRWGWHTLESTLYNSPRARRTGFYHGLELSGY